MFPEIEFNESAFKHDITESNIRHAVQKKIPKPAIFGRKKWQE